MLIAGAKGRCGERESSTRCRYPTSLLKFHSSGISVENREKAMVKAWPESA